MKSHKCVYVCFETYKKGKEKSLKKKNVIIQSDFLKHAHTISDP